MEAEDEQQKEQNQEEDSEQITGQQTREGTNLELLTPPGSPRDRTRGLSPSSSEDEGEAIPNTQPLGKTPPIQQEKEQKSFEQQLNAQDEQTKCQLESNSEPIQDVNMSQAKEERLPGQIKSKAKRKKELSKDPTRASVAMAKPPKNSKK
ncbi:hypothetical protein GOP47_0023048 [Adiantum capillus-veneris]|uniref:Uncharacterized protein n=1 Tax=Adiantum capillus-veneris TaxID=13818 RepID=A0A9D4U6K1_ADICA|nr:hypothetical protein GOP47_0023048 [Adiantum capillus-veneris]